MGIRRLNANDASFDAQFAALIATDTAIDREVERVAGAIVDDVKRRGDAALLEYTNRFDRLTAATVAELEILAPEMRSALDSLGASNAAHWKPPRSAYAHFTSGSCRHPGATPKTMALNSVSVSVRCKASAFTCRAALRLIRRRS